MQTLNSKPTPTTDMDPEEIQGLEAMVSHPISEPRKKLRINRKEFLKLAGVAAAVELIGIGLMYLKPQTGESRVARQVDVGTVDSFSPGSVTDFPVAGFYLVRAADGGFMAVYRRCPHLGCTVNYSSDEGKFLCPCHASAFDFYGNSEKTTLHRALDLYTVKIDSGKVYVDTSYLRRRDHFSPDQLVYG